MDPLVKAALDRVNEAVNGLAWDIIDDIRAKKTDRVPTGRSMEVSIGAAVHAVDTLKSALLSIPNTCM